MNDWNQLCLGDVHYMLTRVSFRRASFMSRNSKKTYNELVENLYCRCCQTPNGDLSSLVRPTHASLLSRSSSNAEVVDVEVDYWPRFHLRYQKLSPPVRFASLHEDSLRLHLLRRKNS
jgi:hypothetical protein